MILTKQQYLKEAQLYLILDTSVNNVQSLLEVLKQSVCSGIDLVQIRAKERNDEEILKLARMAKGIIRGRIPLIINDNIEMAVKSNADGVHVGQDDMPVKIAKRIMGKYKIVGVSCQTLEHVRNAENSGVDYIGFGSVFKTLTKPDRQPMNLKDLSSVVKGTYLPVFAIGGITTDNVRDLSLCGIDKIAVTRAISNADNVTEAVKTFKDALSRKKS